MKNVDKYLQNDEKIVKPPGGKDMALPIDKRRTLPKWLIESAKLSPPSKSPVKAAPKRAGKIIFFLTFEQDSDT